MEQIAANNEWIASQKPGAVFTAADLPHGLTRGIRDVHLAKLAKEKTIMRVMRGVYCIPYYSKLLNEFVPAGVEEVAKAIARRFGWTIMPDDDEAVNGLGLSTQVPARLRFVSDGPTKTYETESGVIEFRHKCLRETRMESRDAKLVIRGLKGLGRYYLTPEIVRRVAERYSDEKWRAICEESSLASDWISEALWNEMRRRTK